MRFLFYDAVIQLDKGTRIRGVKTFSLAEEYLRGHFSRAPIVPATIVIEAMVQLVGWAIVHAHDFDLAAFVSLIGGFSLRSARLRPGLTAEITGEILATSRSDSLGRAWIEVGGERIATAQRIIYKHFRPVDAAALERLFRYYGGPAAAPGAAGGDAGPHGEGV